MTPRLDLDDIEKRWQANEQCVYQIVPALIQECRELQKDRDAWKWEYENLCKFASQFETERGETGAQGVLVECIW